MLKLSLWLDLYKLLKLRLEQIWRATKPSIQPPMSVISLNVSETTEKTGT